MNTKTSQKRVRCRCKEGHSFTTGFFVSIDVEEQPNILESLSEDGTQLVGCPKCSVTWSVAEPITLNHNGRGSFALFVPQVLAHRELEFRADLMRKIAEADPDAIPAHVSDFECLVGMHQLEGWIRTLRPSRKSDLEQEAKPQPDIMRAFADLAAPSVPPEAYSLPSEPPPPDLAAKLGASSSSPPAMKRPSGVDFAGLLTTEDEQDQDDEDDAHNGDSLDDLSFDIGTPKRPKDL